MLTTLFCFKKMLKIVLKIKKECVENKWIFYIHKTNKEVLTDLYSVVLRQEVDSNARLHLVLPPTLLSCSSRCQSCVLYNRTEHSQGFFIC